MRIHERELTQTEMISISGGSMISLKKRLIEIAWRILGRLIEDTAVEAFECFEDSFVFNK